MTPWQIRKTPVGQAPLRSARNSRDPVVGARYKRPITPVGEVEPRLRGCCTHRATAAGNSSTAMTPPVAGKGQLALPELTKIAAPVSDVAPIFAEQPETGAARVQSGVNAPRHRKDRGSIRPRHHIRCGLDTYPRPMVAKRTPVDEQEGSGK